MEPTRSAILGQIQHVLDHSVIRDRRYLDDEQLIRSEQLAVLEAIFNESIREAELRELSSHFAPLLRGSEADHPCHLALWGKTGTGKTLTVAYFLNLLASMCRQRKVPMRYEYLDLSTPRPCFRALNDLACMLNASKRYKKGIALEELMLRIEASLAEFRGYLILFIDEVDHVRRDSDTFFTFLVRRLGQRRSLRRKETNSMCGIIGFIGNVPENAWTETYSILNGLFLAAEHRGRDATGFAAMTEPYKNSLNVNVVTDKEALTASQFIQQNEAWNSLRHRRCSAVLGHVRLETHGSSSRRENLHPFAGHGQHGRGLHLVANGVVIDHESVAKQHGLVMRSENDSETLIRMIESHTNPRLGIDACLRKLDGSVAVAVLDERRFSIWLASMEGRPLWLARLRRDRRWWFASTREILLDGFRRVLPKADLGDFEVLIPLAEDSGRYEWSPAARRQRTSPRSRPTMRG